MGFNVIHQMGVLSKKSIYFPCVTWLPNAAGSDKCNTWINKKVNSLTDSSSPATGGHMYNATDTTVTAPIPSQGVGLTEENRDAATSLLWYGVRTRKDGQYRTKWAPHNTALLLIK
jgi:hypothetical protein